MRVDEGIETQEGKARPGNCRGSVGHCMGINGRKCPGTRLERQARGQIMKGFTHHAIHTLFWGRGKKPWRGTVPASAFQKDGTDTDFGGTRRVRSTGRQVTSAGP